MQGEKAVVVKLNQKQFERLQRRARQQDLGVSEMITKVVEDWLKRQQQQPESV